MNSDWLQNDKISLVMYFWWLELVPLQDLQPLQTISTITNSNITRQLILHFTVFTLPEFDSKVT